MQPLWQPSTEHVQDANLTAFMALVSKQHDVDIAQYCELQAWCVENLDKFWHTFWDFSNVIGTRQGPVIINQYDMEKARFFPQSQLNFTENILQQSGLDPAVIFWSEDKIQQTLSWDELTSQVWAMAKAFQHLGVKPGDRVAAFVPNCIQTLVASLATAAVGAVWASCSPDFGVQGVVDRFEQIQPKIFICAQEYYYNGKLFQCAEKVDQITQKLTSLAQIITFSFTQTPVTLPNSLVWDELMAQHATTTFEYQRFEFNHPLFIMFSSGTTGRPKCILHGAGGTLLQHKKEHLLHCNIKPQDRVFYFTTCGWMMWNWLVSALSSKATVMLYDGSALVDEGRILFKFAQDYSMNLLGTSAKYIETLRNINFIPKDSFDLSSVRTIASTGSPLSPESFDYVYQSIKEDVHLASISGGTDIIGCFCLGNPIGPVYRGQLQTCGLGMDVKVFNSRAQAVSQEKGELVCTTPFPSQPLGFWNDESGEKYHKAYYQRFPGAWHHGDFIETTANDGFIIHGRSDTVLNPGGVRIGTAEIYRQVERHPDVIESLAIGQEWQSDVRIILFVVLQTTAVLDEQLIQQLKGMIKAGASPRHVPAIICQAPQIPKTRNGKIVETIVRDIINHKDVDNIQSLANPECLEFFTTLRFVT